MADGRGQKVKQLYLRNTLRNSALTPRPFAFKEEK